MSTESAAISIPDAGVLHLVQQQQQRCHCGCQNLRGGDRGDGSSCGGHSKRRRSILKAADTDGEPRAHAARKQPVRVEICEQRNKLIFYRQDKGWKVGCFSQHRPRRAQSAAAGEQRQSGGVPANQSEDSSGSSSDCSPSGSPPSNRSCLPQALANQRKSLLTSGDLEISVKVIHACTSGCFAINS